MKSILSKKELAALAMHELMKREQDVYRLRITTQREIALMTDKDLKKMVKGAE